MAKQVITRRASDNRYLHKDFHGALSAGLEYLEQHYGERAVRDYLRQFTRSYYAPVTEELTRRGLAALEEHFAQLYRAEGAEPRISRTDDDLFIEVDACPAVVHMRRQGYPVSRLFYETTQTVNEAICEGTPFAAELLDYDDETGRSTQHFFRRPL